MIDYPNSKKARKVFLCLFVGDGGGGGAQVPRGLKEGDEVADAAEGEDAKGRAKFEKRRQRESRRERSGKQKAVKGGRDWILRKKDVSAARQICHISSSLIALFKSQLYRRRGKEDVPHDSKYTGRKRKAVF